MTGSPAEHPEGRDVAERDADRVRAEYARRAHDDALRAYYGRNRQALEQASAERRSLMLESVDRLGHRGEISILDVGCGTGADLTFLASSGFSSERLAGIDLLDERVAVARASLPGSDVRIANAADLPYADHSFDVALQSVVLSSVTDARVRSMIAKEMARVVRHGGLLISYDMRTVGAGNAQLIPIDEAEAQRLFSPYGQIEMRTLTLNVGIARRVGVIGTGILGRIPWLRTHLLAVVTREPS